MSGAASTRDKAARLPEGDVVAVLLEQHARIRELFAEVTSAEGDRKRQAFDELRALLVVHETAEEMVVRPVARDTAGRNEVEARNHEEWEATKALAGLEKTDITSAEFDDRLRKLEKAVEAHARHEEREEFPTLRAGRSDSELRHMGTMVRAAAKVAPTHPHPGAAGSPLAQWSVGPLASLADRAKDAIRAAKNQP
ncbi:hemerythrin domain-containing protein [Streptomyces caatingaensis]|uniref:Hemerythrin n=1 Tax=Streptomyces caatingaensis TaxID=1678637 RepID=A0A0K9XL90_9ACTN|nr:hemerythrin domain-containing protein [Streptomyces caatingaensis]KNB54053.1 hemerythrin [Streptomyces caatingaensis]